MPLDPLAQFLKAFGFTINNPPTLDQIDDAEKTLGYSLPHSLRTYFATCNGGTAHDGRSSLHLLGLKESVGEYEASGLLSSSLGYFPFVENNDSNPICVCCQSPLRGYIVQVKHDDAAVLKFRSMDDFFRAAASAVQQSDFLDMDALPSDFDVPDRTELDCRVAQELIQLSTSEITLDDLDRTNALRFACDLLPDSNAGEIFDLRDLHDEYVREHVAKRLKRIQSREAAQLLTQMKHEFDSFVERCAHWLQDAGINAAIESPHGKKTIHINPGNIWLNMDGLYSIREQPNFSNYLIDRARLFLSQRGY